MYCPNCGNQNSTEQKFCRKCGMNLEQTSSALLEQFPSRDAVKLDEAERRIERFGQIAFGGFSIVLGIAILGIIYAIITNMILTGQRPWFGALLVAFITLASLTLVYVFMNEDLKDKRKALTKRPMTESAPVLIDSGTKKLLNEPAAESYIPSVIEGTTDLLKVEATERKS